MCSSFNIVLVLNLDLLSCPAGVLEIKISGIVNRSFCATDFDEFFMV